MSKLPTCGNGGGVLTRMYQGVHFPEKKQSKSGLTKAPVCVTRSRISVFQQEIAVLLSLTAGTTNECALSLKILAIFYNFKFDVLELYYIVSKGAVTPSAPTVDGTRLKPNGTYIEESV